MPKQPGNPLTLSLSHRQAPATHLSAPFDLDTTVPQTKGHVSMPPTNPSSIWSIAETDKETPPAQPPSRFNAATQFLHRGSRSSHVGSTSSCERQGRLSISAIKNAIKSNMQLYSPVLLDVTMSFPGSYFALNSLLEL